MWPVLIALSLPSFGRLKVPRPRYPLHGLIDIKYDGRIVREMVWPLAALGHPTNSPSVVGGLAVYTPTAGSAGAPTNALGVVGVPTGLGPSICGDPVPRDDSLRSVPLGNTHLNLF